MSNPVACEGSLWTLAGHRVNAHRITKRSRFYNLQPDSPEISCQGVQVLGIAILVLNLGMHRLEGTFTLAWLVGHFVLGGNQVGLFLASIVSISLEYSLLAFIAICSPNKVPTPMPEPL